MLTIRPFSITSSRFVWANTESGTREIASWLRTTWPGINWLGYSPSPCIPSGSSPSTQLELRSRPKKATTWSPCEKVRTKDRRLIVVLPLHKSVSAKYSDRLRSCFWVAEGVYLYFERGWRFEGRLECRKRGLFLWDPICVRKWHLNEVSRRVQARETLDTTCLHDIAAKLFHRAAFAIWHSKRTDYYHAWRRTFCRTLQ